MANTRVWAIVKFLGFTKQIEFTQYHDTAIIP
eukprot:SAG11_NODE_27693_length_330_cov_0.666667_1_plen_31_part_01